MVVAVMDVPLAADRNHAGDRSVGRDGAGAQRSVVSLQDGERELPLSSLW